ncbi:MAG TPA: glycosyl hydrolase family 18 protein, partial [Patescibacteria group bacterium]|nr:glycosyl hydrolase family 18 protein [Patescibacteria group bacterium]
MTRRTRILAVLGGLVVVALVAGLVLGGLLRPGRGSADNSSTGPGGTAQGGQDQPATPTPEPTPVPTPGHEVYGYLPYWEMTPGITDHLAGVDLTTLALFSVTNKSGGAIDTTQKGYEAIVGPLGEQLIREAHDRGVRVELVYSSFGTTRNKRLFGVSNSPKTQAKLIDGLVALAGQLKVDGINVDVEVIDAELIDAYGRFVGDLRAAMLKAHPKSQVSVATTANVRGSAMALAASTAGADRIFLMAYDYHWSGSGPGASSPIDRRDGDEKDLVWSLDMYAALGVPVERTILGLPLYGMAWPVVGPELGAAQTGKGTNWIPSDHLDFLGDPANVATL